MATLLLIYLVSIWTPFLNDLYLARWFSWPSILFSGVMPILIFVCGATLFRGLQAGNDYAPFLASLGIFALCYVGILISFYPYMVPPSLTIWDVAAPDKSLGFLLVGTVILLPLILAYSGYAYWVFRGKTDPSEGYH